MLNSKYREKIVNNSRYIAVCQLFDISVVWSSYKFMKTSNGLYIRFLRQVKLNNKVNKKNLNYILGFPLLFIFTANESAKCVLNETLDGVLDKLLFNITETFLSYSCGADSKENV